MPDSIARNLADLLDSTGDVKTSRLDNTNNASTLSTGTIPAARIGDASITDAKLSSTLDLSSKTVTLPSASVTAHASVTSVNGQTGAVTVANSLNNPIITGTMSVDESGSVTHTIANWSEELTYVITPTNCTVGSINIAGQFVVTHTTGAPSYTIKSTTNSLGMDDSSLVTKNILMNLSAPTINSPADVGTNENLTYVITSTTADDNKIVLDFGASTFNYQSVNNGTATKVGNTVEVTGFSGNPEITVQFTAEATYSVRAKSANTNGTFGDSAWSATDSLTIQNGVPISYLVVAGGGGGGRGWNAASGGGAGGYRNSYNNETSGRSSVCETPLLATVGTTYTITVGAGGGSLSNGSNSTFGPITSQGGARGWSHSAQGGAHSVANGGCGCGSYSGTPGLGIAGQGHDGMEGMHHALNGGGGGAGEGGLYHVPTGGDGLYSSISGSSVARAGGGGSCNEGGGRFNGGVGGGGSQGGGGSAHTGGGGSASPGSSGSSGGSGIVIIRMPTSLYSGNYSGSPSISTSGNDTILEFTGSGSYTV